MDIDVDDASLEVDDSICPVCRGSTYVGETISCETCHYWFHFECVGVTHNDECVISEDVPYYCPTCCKPKKKSVPNRERKSNPPNKSSRKRKHQATKENDTNSLSTPTKNAEAPNLLLSSPPIKLKIVLGGKRASTFESLNLSKSTTHNSGSSVKESADRKKNKDIEELNDKKTFSDRKKRSKTKAHPASVQPQILNYDGKDDKGKIKITTSTQKDKESDSEEYTEEEKWLNAVEAGNYSSLDKIDSELKNIKDPKLMTARQRAMISGVGGRFSTTNSGTNTPQDAGNRSIENSDTEHEDSFRYDSGHIALDYGTGLATNLNERGCPIQQTTSNPEDDEKLLKQKAAKSALRRKAEMEKREISKKTTIDRLLKKKDSKMTQLVKAQSSSSTRNKFEGYPLITYRISRDGERTLSLAPGMEYPIKKSKSLLKPEVKLCSVCKSKPKKYNCSKTNQYLCSFECYQDNLKSIGNVIL